MKPSPQQQAFIDEMEKGDEPIVLRSGAGTGKTTTMILGVKQTPPEARVVCCAFNRSIADTLEERMPDNCLSKTFHSLGYSAWSTNCGKREKPDQRKTWKIAKNLGVSYDDFPDLARAVGLAKNLGMAPQDKDCHQGLIPDDLSTWQDIFEDFDLDPGEVDNPVDIARDVLFRSVDLAWQGMIDFDDMVYMPAVYGGPLPLAEMVVVDEVQDVNNVQLEMVRRMSAGSRLIAVGDPHQAIYAFRGAGRHAMQNVIDSYQAKVMPLSVSFRCPQAVVEEARRYVDHIEVYEHAIRGTVRRLKEWDATCFTGKDVILCRNNRPLIELAFKLIREGIGCYVKGREIGQGLVKLIDRMKAKNFQQLYSRLEDHLMAEKSKLAAKQKDAQAANLQDRVDSLLCLMDRMGEQTTINQLKDYVEKLFDEKRGLLCLSTIHKAKGMEWPNVYFLDSFLLPSKFAKSDGAIQQEHNLSYVGVTRAQEQLFYIDSEDQG
jgi:superfamily I DNA/RNA helicase